MDFELSDEQAALRQVSRDMLATRCPPELVRSLASAGRDLDEKLWQQGAELGWTGLAVPEEHGGAGQGLAELCLVAEELGRAVAPGPVTNTALTGLILARFAAPDLLPALAAGEVKVSLAGQGRVTGHYEADNLVLRGRATAVQAAAAADWLLVTAATEQGRRLVLVERAGATAEPRRTLDETRRWYDVVLDGTGADVVADDEDGIQWLADAAAVLIAADSLGAGERLLEMTVRHVTTREQFGRALGSFQSVKHKVSDMLMTLKAARAATYYAAMALDADLPGAALAASAAKAFTTAGVTALAGEALQCHGGIGFTWEHDLHLYLRRAKANELLHGTPADHYERLTALSE